MCFSILDNNNNANCGFEVNIQQNCDAIFNSHMNNIQSFTF